MSCTCTSCHACCLTGAAGHVDSAVFPVTLAQQHAAGTNSHSQAPFPITLAQQHTAACVISVCIVMHVCLQVLQEVLTALSSQLPWHSSMLQAQSGTLGLHSYLTALAQQFNTLESALATANAENEDLKHQVMQLSVTTALAVPVVHASQQGVAANSSGGSMAARVGAAEPPLATANAAQLLSTSPQGSNAPKPSVPSGSTPPAAASPIATAAGKSQLLVQQLTAAVEHYRAKYHK